MIIVGGGPAGAALGTLLAQDGHKAIILEKDIHPRDHVGESLTPSTNLVFDRIGFLDKMNDNGFIHKPGTGWNAPRSPLWKFMDGSGALRFAPRLIADPAICRVPGTRCLGPGRQSRRFG